jgi:hypothetical protein
LSRDNHIYFSLVSNQSLLLTQSVLKSPMNPVAIRLEGHHGSCVVARLHAGAADVLGARVFVEGGHGTSAASILNYSKPSNSASTLAASVAE